MHSPLIHGGIDVTWTDVMRSRQCSFFPLHLSVPSRIDCLWREDIRSAAAHDSCQHSRREVMSHFLADHQSYSCSVTWMCHMDAEWIPLYFSTYTFYKAVGEPLSIQQLLLISSKQKSTFSIHQHHPAWLAGCNLRAYLWFVASWVSGD